MTPTDLALLERAVEAQAGRTLGACIRVMPGQLAELLRVYREHESTNARTRPLHEDNGA
jgi:hypothetical protein